MKLDLPYEIEAFTRALRARHRSPATITTYLRAVHQLERYLRSQGIGAGSAPVSITRKTIESMIIDAQERGMSRVTLAQRYRSLQQFFKFVAAESDEPNPMAGMVAINAPVTPPPVIGIDELTKLLGSIRGSDFESRRDLAVVSLFADTGMRRGEMAGISLADVDLREQAIIVTGKTGTRGVPYGSETAARLDRYLRLRRKHPDTGLPWLWLGRKGRLTVYGIEDVVRKRGREAGLAIHPHLFRHTFAHLWLDGGGNEGDLQRLAGWRSPLMLQRYGASAASARARRAYLAGKSPVDRLGAK